MKAHRKLGVDHSAPRGRYADQWETYSRSWDAQYGAVYEYLGDEWGMAEYAQFIFDTYAAPYLGSETRVLEIGPGGGKYSLKLATSCGHLVCADVARSMITRTERRLSAAGLSNFQCVLVDGQDLHQWDDKSYGFVFAFDVFVHLDLEDIYCYLREIARLLTPGAHASIHYANLLTGQGWAHFVRHVDWARQSPKPAGRFSFLSPTMMRQMVTKLGLAVLINEPIGRDSIIVFRSPGPHESTR